MSVLLVLNKWPLDLKQTLWIYIFWLIYSSFHISIGVLVPSAMQRTLGNQEDTVSKVLWGKRFTVHMCACVCVSPLVAVSLLHVACFCTLIFFRDTHWNVPAMNEHSCVCVFVCHKRACEPLKVCTSAPSGFYGWPLMFFAKPVAVVFRLVFHHNSWSMLLPGLLAVWLAGWLVGNTE